MRLDEFKDSRNIDTNSPDNPIFHFYEHFYQGRCKRAPITSSAPTVTALLCLLGDKQFIRESDYRSMAHLRLATGSCFLRL